MAGKTQKKSAGRAKVNVGKLEKSVKELTKEQKKSVKGGLIVNAGGGSDLRLGKTSTLAVDSHGCPACPHPAGQVCPNLSSSVG